MIRPNGFSEFILRARTVLPVSSPPLADGAVVIRRGRILSVGPAGDLVRGDSTVIDLGDVVLLPGLVNAHCHLDYTSMAGQIAAPRTFTDWIKLITAGKSGWLYSDFAASWLAGAKMLLQNGTTTVADVEMSPDLLPEVWDATPLRVLSCLEMTGVLRRRPPVELLQEAAEKIASLPAGRSWAGLSPHAPYSTAPDLLRGSAALARERGWLMVTHLAESVDEFAMFTRREGPLYDWLSRNGRDMADCGLGTPVEHYERAGALHPGVLAVHANCLGPIDAALLGARSVSVAHCPRTHAYFSRPPFPLAELRAAGVNVCLGTDSLASVYQPRRQVLELDLLAEMRQFREAFPGETATDILRMATVNGARALGLAGRAGELSSGAWADVVAIPYRGEPIDAAEAVLEHRGPVTASLIAGEWAFPQ